MYEFEKELHKYETTNLMLLVLLVISVFAGVLAFIHFYTKIELDYSLLRELLMFPFGIASFYLIFSMLIPEKETVYTNKKVTSFTQEMGVDVNPVIYDEDIDLLKQRQQDAEEFLKSLDKTVWCAIPSDTELTQNFSNDDLVIFYRGIDIDLLMQQYPQYKYYKLNITEAADCKGKGE